MLLKFNIEAVRNQFEHAKQSTTHKPTFGEQIDAFGDDAFGMDYDEIVKKLNEQGKIKPALWLVKDNGIYIMSNGDGDNRPDVVYAQGYNPNKDGDMWDKCRDAMGGDDCCELIDHDTVVKLISVPNAKILGIKVTANQIDFRVYT
ncbi:MAG: DUF3085 domain-containing protein [Gammaproteobacteria bacterium]|nr:DUF3085 domain-containing protein [Gammaproteobacteria bacterium]